MVGWVIGPSLNRCGACLVGGTDFRLRSELCADQSHPPLLDSMVGAITHSTTFQDWRLPVSIFDFVANVVDPDEVH